MPIPINLFRIKNIERRIARKAAIGATAVRVRVTTSRHAKPVDVTRGLWTANMKIVPRKVIVCLHLTRKIKVADGTIEETNLAAGIDLDQLHQGETKRTKT